MPDALADGGPAAWDDMGHWYGRRCIDTWCCFAPNLSEGAVHDWVLRP